MLKAQPRGDRVLVLQDPVEETTKSGIIIPGATAKRNRPLQGTVKAVGPDVKDLKVDDRVEIRSNMAGNSTISDGEEVTIVNEKDIILKFDFEMPSIEDVHELYAMAKAGVATAVRLLMEYDKYLEHAPLTLETEDTEVILEIKGALKELEKLSQAAPSEQSEE